MLVYYRWKSLVLAPFSHTIESFAFKLLKTAVGDKCELKYGPWDLISDYQVSRIFSLYNVYAAVEWLGKCEGERCVGTSSESKGRKWVCAPGPLYCRHWICCLYPAQNWLKLTDFSTEFGNVYTQCPRLHYT